MWPSSTDAMEHGVQRRGLGHCVAELAIAAQRHDGAGKSGARTGAETGSAGASASFTGRALRGGETERDSRDPVRPRVLHRLLHRFPPSQSGLRDAAYREVRSLLSRHQPRYRQWGEAGASRRLCPYREHALGAQEHEAWDVVRASQGQLRLGPSGYVIGIDMSTAL
jgi:ribosome modulation factor